MAKSKRKLIVLDRDGVINFDSDDYVKSAEEWVPIPGSLEAIALLKKSGYIVALATNQSGVGRGYYTEADIEAMHSKMQQLLMSLNASVDYIAYCPHMPDDGCDCRKPRTGLLQEISNQLRHRLDGVWLIGDSLRDLQAAESMHMQPVLVCTGKGAKTRQREKLPPNTLFYLNLQEAVEALLSNED